MTEHLRVFIQFCKFNEPSKVFSSFHRSSWSFRRSSENFHGFNGNSSFLYFLPLASTNFHRLPFTSAKSPYACISYHELQALPPWRREGRSFPSISYLVPIYPENIMIVCIKYEYTNGHYVSGQW